MADFDFSNHPQYEMAPWGSLKPNPKNPRKHPPKQIEQLVQSLRRFGFRGALVVDEDGIILAGNALWEAAGRCGFDEVPVLRAKFLSEADRRAFALTMNRLAESSNWDMDLVKADLEFLFDNDYDFSVTGFGMEDLDLGVTLPGEIDERFEPPRAGAVAVSRESDCWSVGPHRLFNGNARMASSYEALLGNELATMVFADAPFNVPIDGHVSGQGQVRHREFAEAVGEMSKSEFTAFLRVAFRMCARFSIDGSIHAQCMDWRHMGEMLDAADGVYSELKNLAVWVKDNAGLGSMLRSRHELIFLFKSGRGKHINNVQLGKTGRYRTNVWEYAGANSFRKGRKEDLAAHPTVKPVAMVADAILDNSNLGDIILDNFCGSGTTLLAAHHTGRRGAGIELDPIYIDTALRRLAAASGLIPTLSDGRSFDQVAEDRANEEKLHG